MTDAGWVVLVCIGVMAALAALVAVLGWVSSFKLARRLDLAHASNAKLGSKVWQVVGSWERCEEGRRRFIRAIYGDADPWRGGCRRRVPGSWVANRG